MWGANLGMIPIFFSSFLRNHLFTGLVVVVGWQKQGKVNVLLVMQLKSVKPTTPALFQMLISLWLLSPRSQSTSRFFFLFVFFLILCCLFTWMLFAAFAFSPCLGRVFWLFAADCDRTYNLNAWIFFHQLVTLSLRQQANKALSQWTCLGGKIPPVAAVNSFIFDWRLYRGSRTPLSLICILLS